MRLGKFLAHAGVASRRHSETIVRDGRVRVDGELELDPARPVEETTIVEVDGRRVAILGSSLVLALHKPLGVVSTAQDTHGRLTVVDLVADEAEGRRVYPVGRLDADTTGLIVLTDDGDLAERLTHPRFEVPKTYLLQVERAIGEKALAQLRRGVKLDDGMTAPAKVRRVGPSAVELTIHEGRKHQVRRMAEAVGHRTAALRRTAIGPLRLGRMAPGAVRRLTPDEEQALRAAPKRQRSRSSSTS
jgi:23S rRNA pseudouridine2605 synthase